LTTTCFYPTCQYIFIKFYVFLLTFSGFPSQINLKHLLSISFLYFSGITHEQTKQVVCLYFVHLDISRRKQAKNVQMETLCQWIYQKIKRKWNTSKCTFLIKIENHKYNAKLINVSWSYLIYIVFSLYIFHAILIIALDIQKRM
jgi:hypothetical protein